MVTHDAGRFFWQVIRVTKDCPVKHRWETRENSWPYRWSNSLILRLPVRYALVLGWWHDPDAHADELDLLHRAILVHRGPDDVQPGTAPMCGPQLCGVTHAHTEDQEDADVRAVG